MRRWIDRALLIAAWLGMACFATFGTMAIAIRADWHFIASLVAMGVWMFAGLTLIQRRRAALPATRDMEASNG